MRQIKKVIAAKEAALISKMLTDSWRGKTVQIVNRNKTEAGEKLDDKEGICKRIRSVKDDCYYFEVELDDFSRYQFFSKNSNSNKFDGRSWTFIGYNRDIKILLSSEKTRVAEKPLLELVSQ